MKAQILSRIQSCQNIPININTNNNYNCLTNTQSSKIINQAKFIKYAVNVRDSPQGNIKILSPSAKVNSHRLLLSTAAIISSKKKLSSTFNKDIKRSVNLGNQTAQKINDYWNIKNTNKINNKQIIDKNRQLQSNLRGSQNQPNKLNIQKQKYNTNYTLPKCQNMQTKKLSRQLFKQTTKHNITRKKELIRIYSKVEINKDLIGIQSDKNIPIVKYNNQVKDPQKYNKNHIMTKTFNVFKDQKQISYLGLSSKKFNIRSPQKQIQLKSDNRIPISTLIQKQKQQDISIEMSIQENYKQNQEILQNQNLEFGCSQIKQRCIENDSSFLESVQKNVINQIQQNSELPCNKKKWKKLPNDFLKI